MANTGVEVRISGKNDSRAAFSQVDGQLGGFLKSIGGVSGVLKTLAIGEVTRRLLDLGRQAIESAGDLHEMSQRTGVGAEQLSELKYAAEIADVSFENLEKGIRKFQTTISDAARGNKEAQASLRAVGLEARDANGKIVQAADGLERIADKFAKTKDGTEKAALAVKLFGRSGTELIPLLNQGSAGIAKLREEAHKLGVALTAEDVAAADELADNLKRLEAASRGVMQHFLSGLVPSLNKVVESALESAGGFNVAKGAGELFGGVMKVITAILETVGILCAWVAGKFLLLADAAKSVVSGDLKAAGEQLKQFFGFIEDPAAKDLSDRLNKMITALFSAGDASKQLGDGVTDDLKRTGEEADAIARAQLKSKLDALRHEADSKKQFNDLELQRLQTLYQAELLTVREYFDQRKALQVESLQAEFKAIEKQLDLLSAAMKGSTNQKENLQTLAQFNQLSQRSAVLLKEIQQLQNQDASGKTDPLLQRAENMKLYGEEAARVEQQISIVFAKLEEEIARVDAAVRNHHISAIEGEQQTNQLRSEAADKVSTMVDKYYELAEASGDPRLIANAEKLGRKYEELGVKLNTLRDQAIDATERGFENLFGSLITNSESAADAFKSFGKSIIGTIGQIIAKMITMFIVSKFLGFLFPKLGGFGGGFGIGSGASGNVSGTGFIGETTFFAEGGHMNAGQIGVVGDGGEPELWVPDQPGSVIPFSKLGRSGGGDGDTYYIHAPYAQPGAEMAIMHAIAKAHSDAAVKRADRNRVEAKLRGAA